MYLFSYNYNEVRDIAKHAAASGTYIPTIGKHFHTAGHNGPSDAAAHDAASYPAATGNDAPCHAARNIVLGTPTQYPKNFQDFDIAPVICQA